MNSRELQDMAQHDSGGACPIPVVTVCCLISGAEACPILISQSDNKLGEVARGGWLIRTLPPNWQKGRQVGTGISHTIWQGWMGRGLVPTELSNGSRRSRPAASTSMNVGHRH